MSQAPYLAMRGLLYYHGKTFIYPGSIYITIYFGIFKPESIWIDFFYFWPPKKSNKMNQYDNIAVIITLATVTIISNPHFITFYVDR